MSFEFEAPNGLEQRLRRARSEIERRVRGGEVNVAQQLLATMPGCSSDPDFAIELIYAEFVVLEEVGAKPTLGDTLERYPQWRDKLERLLKVHDALTDTGNLDLAESADTHVCLESVRDEASTSEAAVENRRVGQYELLEEIGCGGMGLVYKALQRGLNRTVAVKLIRSAANATEAERARFRTEAEAAATLQHPNIVQIYEVGNHEGCDFLSMEYVEGGNLESYLKTQAFSVRAAAELIATLAGAIHTAHQHGIIHRDLKPANILLAGDAPKISDFGLAKQVSGIPVDQTQSGALLGTPCYMSPEQADGRTSETSAATDVYALGAILYELLAGRPPFVGQTAMETLDLIRGREPERPSLHHSKLPRDVETICLKCLAKEPRSRYTSALDLANDLHRFLRHEPIHARPVGVVERTLRWMRRRPVVVSLLAMLGVITLASAYAITHQQKHVGELAESAAASQRKADEDQRRAEEAINAAAFNQRQAAAAIDQLSQLGGLLHEQPGMGERALATAKQAAQRYEALLEDPATNDDVRLKAGGTYHRIGKIQLEKGQPELATESLRQAIDIYQAIDPPTDAQYPLALAYVYLGHSLRNINQWSASDQSYLVAIEIFEELIRLDPGNDEYPVQLANTLMNSTICLRDQGRHEQAFSALVRSMSLLREETENQLNHDALVSDDTDGSSLHSTDEPAQLAFHEVQLANTLLERIKTGDAAITMQLAERLLPTELALNLDELAIVFTDVGRPQYALEAFSLALAYRQLTLDLIPGQHWRKQLLARSHNYLGNHYYETNAFAEAETSFAAACVLLEDLVAAFPSRAPYRDILGQLYFALGLTKARLGKLDESATTFDESIVLFQQLVAANESTSPTSQDQLGQHLYLLGRAYAEKGQAEPAIDAYRESLSINVTPATQNHLAWELLTAADSSVRDPQQALGLAKRAVEGAPQKATYWNTLGVAHYRNGDFDQANQALLQAIEVHPQDGTVFDWFFLAMSHAKQGNVKTARVWRERANAWCQSQNALPHAMHRTQDECAEVFGSLD